MNPFFNSFPCSCFAILQIRDDIPHQSPSNMGTNKLLPKLIDKRLRNTPTEWSHQNAELFIGEEGPRGNNVRVRYLPRSNAIQMPRMAFQNDTNRMWSTGDPMVNLSLSITIVSIYVWYLIRVKMATIPIKILLVVKLLLFVGIFGFLVSYKFNKSAIPPLFSSFSHFLPNFLL